MIRPELEEKLYHIVSESSGREDERLESVKKIQSSELLATLSPRRKDAISWLPLKEGMEILQIHPGYGELSEWITSQTHNLTVLPDSKEAKRIICLRCPGSRTIEHLPKSEYFDSIIWNVNSERELQDNVDAIRSLLKRDGYLVLFLNNQIGISKIAEYYVNQPTEKGVSFAKIRRIVKSTGMSSMEFYPSPNSVFVHDVYTEKHMPTPGFTFGNTPDYYNERIQVIDQADISDKLIEEGLYSNFFDTMICVVGNQIPEEIRRIEYIHFSDRRVANFCTVTKIINDGEKKQVTKSAYTDKAEKHIKHLLHVQDELNSIYAEEHVKWNKIHRISDNEIQLEYLEGDTLSDKLDDLLLDEDYEKAKAMVSSFFKALKEKQQIVTFEETDAFNNIFGNAPKDKDESLLLTDLDCIFDNVYVRDNNTFEISDYEWTFTFPIPLHFIIYRCIHYYLNYRPIRKQAIGMSWYRFFNISDNMIECYEKMERNFQKYVSGEENLEQDLKFQKPNFLLSNIVTNYRKTLYEEQKMHSEVAWRAQKMNPVAFEIIDPSDAKDTVKDGFHVVSLNVGEQYNQLYFEPSSTPGILIVKSIKDKKGDKLKAWFHQMKKISQNVYFCYSSNPQVFIDVSDSVSVRIIYRFEPLTSESIYGKIPIEEERFLTRTEQERIYREYL